LRVEMHIYGEGPLKIDLDRWKEGLPSQTSGLVTIHGWVAKMDDDFYDQHDVFVLPSHWEGLPYAILDAMSRGIPVIATDVGGIPELIKDQETGVLVPVQCPVAIAEAIINLAIDGGLRDCLGRQGREWIQNNFSRDCSTEQIVELISLLSSDGEHI
jgi:glycosyltransferase involved in cell wall biosynthesis